jgi:hypothetical protein
MNTKTILWLGLGGLAIYAVYSNQDLVEQAATQVQAAVMGWKNVNSGPQWVPVLNAVEQQYGFPADMLAAVAFQESGFREGVIRGTTPSSDGLSLGIMQLQTRYYPALVGPDVPVPYSDSDVENQINQAAIIFQANYNVLQSWPATIAAWNQGLTGVQTNGITSTSYVANILGNAPAANV